MALSEAAGTRKTVTSRGTIRRARRAGGLRGAAIQFTLRHGGQLLVRRFFLVEILLKQCRAIVAPEFLCPRDQRAIARDLIVLDRLRRSDERGIQNRLVLDLARDLFGLVDDAVDGGAIHPPRLLAVQLEDLFQTRHVILGLTQMGLQTLLELP